MTLLRGRLHFAGQIAEIALSHDLAWSSQRASLVMIRGTTLRRLGGYELEACISAGATTHVYRARRNDQPGPVALKLLAPALTVHPELVAAFRSESELSLQLRHPNLPQALDAGTSSGVPYLVMELLDGPTVAALMERIAGRRTRMPVGAALTIARDACRALGYAHHFVDENREHKQIIHGDVSPANLIVCANGVVKLIDFGIARVAGPFDCDITATGSGRHAYMAPEQGLGEPIDRRVDVFAVGVVLRELLEGQTDVPRLAEGIARRALSPDRAQRYPSGAAMARALDTLAGMLYSRLRMAELVRDLEAPKTRGRDQETAPIENFDVAAPDDWNRWDTARVDVG
jgi:serine/threonine protein kinase